MAESTVTVTVSYVTLDDPAALGTALEQALTRGYHGTITALRNAEVDMWALVLNTPSNISPVTCSVGDVLLWDGVAYQSLDADTFAQRYDNS